MAVQDLLQEDFRDDPTKEVVDVPTSEPLDLGSTELDLEQVGESPMQEPEVEPQTTEDLLDSALTVATGQTEEEIQAERDVQRAERDVLNTLEEPSDRAREEARLEERVGIPGFEQDIADLNSAIRLKAASLRRGLVDTEGRPIAMQFITGRQAQMKRIAAAEIEGLSAAVSAAQGNIAAAESRIDRALNRKYGDTEANINRALSVLEVNESRFTRAEKKAAQERESELKKLQSKIDRAKELEKAAQEAIVSAIKNGLSPTKGSRLMERLVNGRMTPADVFNEVGDKLVEEDLLDTQVIELGDGRKQLINKQTGDIIETFGSVTPTDGEELPDGATPLDRTRIDDKVKTIDKLIKDDSPVLGLLVGNLPGDFVFNLRRPDTAESLATIDTLISELTIESLVEAKSRGATFGALSDTELQVLAAAASRVSAKAVRTEKFLGFLGGEAGRLKGFRGTKEGLLSDLRKIKEFAILDFERRTGTKFEDINDSTEVGVDEFGNIVIPGDKSNEEFWKQ